MNELYFNDQYSITYFKESVARKQDKYDGVVSDVAEIIGNVIKTEIPEGEEETRFVVNMTEELIDAIKSGKIKLDHNKTTGELYAQLRNGNQFGKKLSIREEVIEKGIDTTEAIDSIQFKLLEEKLEQIIDTLSSIESDVDDIIQGQENDRIAMYYTGLNLYLETKSIEDATLRKFITAQSIHSLSEANAKMVQQIKSDIRFLLEKQYKQQKGKSAVAINETMESINKAFEVIHRSAVLKAQVYYENNELQAMLTVIDEYGEFLKQLIVPNVPKLIEYDINAKYLQGNVWEQRADMMLEMNNLKQNLIKGNVLYIDTKEKKYVEG